jgi:hypothetical protein
MRRLALALLALLVVAPPAQAVTLVTPDGTAAPQPWQAWADNSLVPTPAGTVTFANDYCPATHWSACYTPLARVIYMAGPNAANRAQFFHELGHDFDSNNMTDAYRAGFIRIMRYRTPSWWAAANPVDAESAGERFATAYSVCARRQTIARDGWRYGPGHGYGYSPTRAQHRRVCALIRRAALHAP